MTETMPLVFMGLCAAALVAAVFMFSRSFAAVFGDASVDDSLPRVLPEDQQSLLDEKRALLVALRDLENERQLSKVSEEDYKRLEAQYRGRARRVLQQLDGSVAPFREDAERLIAEHLAKQGVSPATAPSTSTPAPASEPTSTSEPTSGSLSATGESGGVRDESAAASTSAETPSSSPTSTTSGSLSPNGERAGVRGEATSTPVEVDAKNAKPGPRACSACETVNDDDAAFCKKCGTRMEATRA